MAKDKKSKNIITTSSGKEKVIVKAASASGSLPRASRNAANTELLFNKQNYLFIGAAFGLIVLGMLLMMGGSMPDANTWDESLIYSTRRTLIAPIVILIGLVVGIVAIFRD